MAAAIAGVFSCANVATNGYAFLTQAAANLIREVGSEDQKRRYLPELAAVPDKFIHAPWQLATAAGLDYPPPIVDHAQARTITLELFKLATNGLVTRPGLLSA